MKSDSRERTYTGDVVRKRFARGSKSERASVMLETRYGDFVLRSISGHAFSDPAIAALVGKRIRVRGIRQEHVLVVIDWKEVR